MNKLLVGLFLLASQCLSQTSYIKDWLVIGTFPNPEAATRLSRDYLQGESAVIPRGGESLQGHRWVIYHSPLDYLNLRNSDLSFSPSENCVAYAAIFVQSPVEQSVHLFVGSDDAIAVWCNGRRIHFLEAHRGIQLDNDTVTAVLRKGWNTLLFKVANADGGYALSARLGNGKDLVATPVNPFPPSQELTPAQISLDTSSITTRFVFTSENQPELHLDVRVSNSGMADEENATLSTSMGERTLEIPAVYGGEVKDVSFVFPFREAMSAGSQRSHGTVTLEYGKSRFTKLFPASEKILRALFSPWSLEGESVAHEHAANLLFSRTIRIPPDLSGLGLRFMVDIGDSRGEVRVNGKTLLTRFSGDSGDLLLTPRASSRDSFRVEVKAIEPTASSNQPARRAALLPFNEQMQLYLDDVRFAREIYGVDPGSQEETLKALFGLLHAGQADQAAALLKEPLARLSALKPKDKEFSLHFVGNAHIDMAWLWRYTETMEVTHATLQAAVDNLKTDPNFTFAHGQAQSYQWIEEKDPALFREIQSFVKQGRWEIVGGTWVESDANIPSGEALARQFLYGKRYFKRKFGVDVKHGWYPDTFGHPATLPSILSGCGMDSYTFFRPEQQERMFTWQGPDGNAVLAHHPSNWYGTWNPLSDTLWKSAVRSCQLLGVSDALQFYGVGDHGGGPTRRDIATIEHLSKLSLYPKVKFSTMQEYYQAIAAERPQTPAAHGEQNPVFEGCYTSQAMVKADNRKAEALLPTAEAFSIIATQYGFEYPGATLEEAWHRILFNQFHDILCGSGIHAVYDDARIFYEEAFQKAGAALDGSTQRIARFVNTRQSDRALKPILLFNPLNWKRVDPVTVTLPVTGGKSSPRIFADRGKRLDVQVIESTPDSVRFVFLPDSLPSVGYRTFWVRLDEPPAAPPPGGALRQEQELILENRYFWIEIDRGTGAVSRIYDKTHRRELLLPGARANQLTIQEDDAGMSAWVIGLKGEPRPINVPSSIQVVENGPVRKTIRVEYRYEVSSFTQDITLYAALPRIDFHLVADWMHRKRILKVGFPLNLAQGKATFDIPYGAIERPANGKEVVVQKWVDVSTPEYGLSLLNDAKYGCDVNGSTIHLTALRSPTDPDPKADEGHHEFSYTLYPHEGTWKEGLTVRQGYNFNTPVAVARTGQHRGRLSPTFSFLQFDTPGFVLAAVKRGEDDNSVILRGYETLGRPGDALLKCWTPMKEIQETDIMEWQRKGTESILPGGKAVRLKFGAHEIKTWKIRLKP